MVSNKKSSIILILKVLKDYSDEDHYLTLKEIILKLYDLYNIELERKSVSSSIDLLIELGYDINKTRNGVALISRLFDETEAKFLDDAIFSSKSITSKQANELMERINSIFSVYKRQNYSYLYKNSDITRSDNNFIFYNISVIEEAIRLKKRISFKYLTYDLNGHQTFRNNNYRYIVSPYYLVNNFGRYYLICNYREKYNPINIFRIDFMFDLKIENNWEIKKIDSLKLTKKFNLKEFLNERIYLFNGEVINAKIEILNPQSIIYIKDWFGDNGHIYKEDQRLFFDIKCDENSLFYWLIQYSKDFYLISPSSLLDRIIKFYQDELMKYLKK